MQAVVVALIGGGTSCGSDSAAASSLKSWLHVSANLIPMRTTLNIDELREMDFRPSLAVTMDLFCF